MYCQKLETGWCPLVWTAPTPYICTCPPAAAPVFGGAFHFSLVFLEGFRQGDQKHLGAALNTQILPPLLTKINQSSKQFGLLALKRHPLADWQFKLRCGMSSWLYLQIWTSTAVCRGGDMTRDTRWAAAV
jgi:hypothetical protein